MSDAKAAVCPACKTSTSTELWGASSIDAAQHFIRKESDAPRNAALAEHIEWLWGQSRCSVMHCDACGLGFSFPFIAGDEKFYNLAFPRLGYPKDRWEYARTIGDMEKSHGAAIANTKCLEIGSGVGFFLEQLSALGVASDKILALEYNEQSLKALQEKGYSGKAINLADLDDSKFDFIFMFQVLEHMDKLDDLFSRISQLLAKNGALYLSVPHRTRTDFNESSGGLQDMPPNHISRWTSESLRQLLTRHNLELQETELEPCSLTALCQQDLQDFVLRKSMTPNTLAANAYNMPRTTKRKIALMAVALVYLFQKLPLWFRMVGTYKTLGGALWIKASVRA